MIKYFEVVTVISANLINRKFLNLTMIMDILLGIFTIYHISFH